MPSRNPSFTLDGPEVGFPEPTPAAKAPRKRTGFFVPITQDGQIDMSRAKPEQIAQLQTAIGKPEEKPEEKPKIKADIKPEYILQAYSLLEVVIQLLGKRFLKWPPDLAVEMHFSEDKKRAMVAPTKELADMYAPDWLVTNQPLAALAIAFSDAVNDMVNRASERYVQKVLEGRCPPPPGFRFPPGPLPSAAPSQPLRVAPIPAPVVAPPTNGEAKPPQPVTASQRGFMPAVPANMGVA